MGVVDVAPTVRMSYRREVHHSCPRRYVGHADIDVYSFPVQLSVKVMSSLERFFGIFKVNEVMRQDRRDHCFVRAGPSARYCEVVHLDALLPRRRRELPASLGHFITASHNPTLLPLLLAQAFLIRLARDSLDTVSGRQR